MRIEWDDPQQPINLVQITDMHLGDQPGEALLGMDTDQSFGHVLRLVKAEQAQIDVLLATGDISNSGTLASYQRFNYLTDSLARHVFWLPGNHDSLPVMQQAVAGGEQLSRSVAIGNWQIIMLNSTTPGEVGGNFSGEELAFLRQALEEGSGQHVLVCLHHHPIPIGCQWLDQQQVANSDEFFNVLDQYDGVRGVLWGHIHQTIDQLRNNVQLMATPSSCIQFAANSDSFKLAKLNPGYRQLQLHSDGRIETTVSRVTGVEFDIDYNYTGGY